MAIKFNEKEAEDCGIPGHMFGGLKRWIDEGVPPGDFLTCVFKNDLMGALDRADGINKEILHRYGEFLYNHAPLGCWGSEERYFDWIKTHGETRRAADKAGGQ